MKRRTQGGYIGLVALLVSVLILGILFVRWMTAPTQTIQNSESVQPLTASGTIPTTRTEEYRADIDAAEAVQKSIDVDTAKLKRELDM